MTNSQQKKILIIGTNMMNLYNHRLELIKRLLNLNFKVVIAAPESGEEKNLEDLGCKFIAMPVDNRGTNIKNDLRLINDIRTISRREKPDLILTFYTKTNIYGGIVAGRLKIPYIENICGLGTSLVKENMLGKFMQVLYKLALRKSSFVFFQNKDNVKFMHEKNIYTGQYDLLPGSGVSLTRYQLLPYPETPNIEFLFCSRVIKEKGIDHYIEAAQKIKAKYPDTVFHVVGPCNPEYEDVLREYDEKGVIKYHGKLMDLHPIYQRVHCSVLPSYYPEGMANVLLESAACGRPLITTGLPGCGEAVTDNVTGYVVNEKDTNSLVDALERFILLSPQEKKEMGLRGREKMEKEFNRDIVTDRYISHIKQIIP